MAQVTNSMLTMGRPNSGQSEVWADIAEKMANLRTSSPTGAMAAMFEQHGSFIDNCAAALHPIADWVGALFAIDNSIVGLDLFDSHHTLRALLPKLVRSVAVDALDRTGSRAVGRMTDPETTGPQSCERRRLPRRTRRRPRLGSQADRARDHRARSCSAIASFICRRSPSNPGEREWRPDSRSDLAESLIAALAITVPSSADRSSPDVGSCRIVPVFSTPYRVPPTAVRLL